MIPNLIIPERPSQEYLIRLVRAQYQVWREEKEAREPKWVPENVRFEHDPRWRERFWSIQAMHDGVGFWKVGKLIYLAAAAAPYLVRLIG